MSWHELAACRDEDPALFFGEGIEGRAHDYAPALAICAGCPVRDECLEAGLYEPAGVWGGLAPRARAKIARERPDTVACTSCGALLPRTRQGQRQPWCAEERCQKECARRRNVAWRQRQGVA